MLIKETDYGTPAATGKMVTLEIDGHEITVPEGTSIMRAAMELGTKIPKLCATDSLKSFGSCRLCLVEIEGRKGTPASCTTPVAPGIKVRTQTERLASLRKGVMELYISDHPLDCLTCAANGDCELQTWRVPWASETCATAMPATTTSPPARPMAKRTSATSRRTRAILFHLRSRQVHRLLALRARLRGSARHLRPHHRRPRLCLACLGRHG